MTEQNKQLLLKDLSARLAYRPKFKNPYFIDIVNTLVAIEPDYSKEITSEEVIVNGKYTLDEVRLYLRPMSSMTDKEKKEYKKLQTNYEFGYFDNIVSIDWLNANNFDYRGLIPRSLAIPVTKENNPYK